MALVLALAGITVAAEVLGARVAALVVGVVAEFNSSI